MSNSVDIKIAHFNKTEITNDAFDKDAVFDILNRTNYEALAPHYKFHQIWF